jgi:hypothetical protein
LGALSCIECPEGSYQSLDGQFECVPCPPGRSAAPGTTGCEDCAQRQYAPEAGSACVDCPQSFEPNPNHTACLCGAGFFFGRSGPSATQPTCLACPEGIECLAQGATLDSLTVRPGYWRSSTESLDVYRCLVDAHCEGGREAECAANREGPLCALCRSGTQPVVSGGCEACASRRGVNVFVTVLVSLVVLAAMGLVYAMVLYTDRSLLLMVMQKDARRVALIRERHHEGFDRGGYDEFADPTTHSGAIRSPSYRPLGKPNLTYKLKIIVGFFQVSTNLAFALQMPWPRTFVRFVSAFNVFNLDFVQWASVSCVTRVDFFTKLILITLIPLFIVASVVAVFLVGAIFCAASRALRVVVASNPCLSVSRSPSRRAPSFTATARACRTCWRPTRTRSPSSRASVACDSAGSSFSSRSSSCTRTCPRTCCAPFRAARWRACTT